MFNVYLNPPSLSASWIAFALWCELPSNSVVSNVWQHMVQHYKTCLLGGRLSCGAPSVFAHFALGFEGSASCKET